MVKYSVVAFVLMISFMSNVSLVNAQQNIPNDPNNQAPAPGQTGGTTDLRDDGFSWWWILPLLAIPLLFLLRRNNREEDTTNYRNQSMAGSKGGEAKRDLDNDTP